MLVQQPISEWIIKNVDDYNYRHGRFWSLFWTSLIREKSTYIYREKTQFDSKTERGQLGMHGKGFSYRKNAGGSSAV
jgi:hypothetical protein